MLVYQNCSGSTSPDLNSSRLRYNWPEYRSNPPKYDSAEIKIRIINRLRFSSPADTHVRIGLGTMNPVVNQLGFFFLGLLLGFDRWRVVRRRLDRCRLGRELRGRDRDGLWPFGAGGIGESS